MPVFHHHKHVCNTRISYHTEVGEEEKQSTDTNAVELSHRKPAI